MSISPRKHADFDLVCTPWVRVDGSNIAGLLPCQTDLKVAPCGMIIMDADFFKSICLFVIHGAALQRD